MRKKILTIIGARPQFIKASAISREIKNYNNLEEIIVHTGQHFDENMSDKFFTDLDIPAPKYKFSLENRTHSGMTGEMLIKLDPILTKEKPDFILVFGDTNSTLAGALAGVKLHIPIIHIEAGLRSYNNYMPEEINRILTDRISTYLFCTSDSAVQNLYQENIKQNVHNVGDVMYDSVVYFNEKGINKTEELEQVEIKKDFILATVHRQENTDDVKKLEKILDCLKVAARTNQVILPLHPRTKNIINNCKIDVSGITIIEPVGYFSMLYLLNNCKMVCTDSGGLQKEAYFFNKFVCILRDETEWFEIVDAGLGALVGDDVAKIQKIMNSDIPENNQNINLYGDGNASKKILDIISA